MPGYADLDPPRVLAALDAVGLRGDGRLLQLNSYENRVFQVFLEDGSAVVAKFYRPGRWSDAQILEEHAFATELAQGDIPVVAPRVLDAIDGPTAGCAPSPGADPAGSPGATGLRLHGTPPTLARFGGDTPSEAACRFSVSPRRAGRAPELEDTQVLQWLGRFLGRLHAVGARRAFAHRRTLDPASFGDRSRRLLMDGGFVPEAQAPAWAAASEAALAAVHAAFADAGAVRRLRLHGDCHPGNIQWRDEGPHVVDLDDACTGPAVQDLWMLLSGDAAAMGGQLGALLAGYRAFMDFDPRELALIEPLRTLRMLHHSAWIAERWSDPAFPAAFPWFGTPAYWQQQADAMREQVEAMQAPPIEPYG